MKGNLLKKKLSNNELTIGSWITLGYPSIGEIMSQAGFDWLTIDIEHSVITLEQVGLLIQAIQGQGKDALVRVGENDKNLIKRVMDAGASGVIVPMVNNADEALQAVRSVKYPPYGERGVGLSRAQRYGFAFEEYKTWVKDSSVVIVMIEHIDAINNLDKILSVPGVDGTIIGPYDLSGSLGYPGDFERAEVKKAIVIYESVCKKMGKPMGFHIVNPEAEKISEYITKGYSFVALGADEIFLGRQARKVVGQIKMGIY